MDFSKILIPGVGQKLPKKFLKKVSLILAKPLRRRRDMFTAAEWLLNSVKNFQIWNFFSILQTANVKWTESFHVIDVYLVVITFCNRFFMTVLNQGFSVFSAIFTKVIVWSIMTALHRS